MGKEIIYGLRDREYIERVEIEKQAKGIPPKITRFLAGHISDEKVGNLNLIVKTDENGFPLATLKGKTIPFGFAQVGINEVAATIVENGYQGKSYFWDCRKYKPTTDLSGVTIKLYKSTPIFKKALDCIKGTPLGKEILGLEGIIGKKQLNLTDFENTVNGLKAGDAYEQALFIMLRNKLIEEGIMPIDQNGKPYDLASMHIPAFDIRAYLQKLGQENQKEASWLWTYYEFNRPDPDARMTEEDFVRTISKLKDDAPGKYAAMYQFLVDNKYIHPTINDLNLDTEQLAFMQVCHNAGKYQRRTANGEIITDHAYPEIDAIFTHLNDSLRDLIRTRVGEKEAKEFDILKKSKAWLAKHNILINRTISKLRFGDWDEREEYNNFCGAVRDLNNTIILEESEKPSYPERRKSMFAAARAQKAKAPQTIEDKL